ncbi:MAG: RNA pseudouridine synthase [Tenericutes bacterium]|nr:RNA pseudouridine synthase [Mycoplasmatota bacterium]
MKNKKKKLKILFEDKSIIVINKPSGLLTIKTDNTLEKNLYSEVYDYMHKKNKNNKIFIVHRLDRDTSGIVVFAKSEQIKRELQDNWNDTDREYVAVVHGKTKNHDIIKSYIAETKTFYNYSTNNKNEGKYAETEYELIKYNKQYSLLKVIIKTGRKNQIRVHMKDNNTPIVGDRKYGVKDNSRKMLLIANKLSFTHPVTKEKTIIELPIPKEYETLVE